MADTIKTIGSTGDYADPILWAAGQGGISDGNREVGELIENVTMSALFRPNQAFVDGGLLRGDTVITGEVGIGRILANTAATRFCLAPSPNIEFCDLRISDGGVTKTTTFQNINGNTFTRIISMDSVTGGTINPLLDSSGTTANNCALYMVTYNGSTTAGDLTLNNCYVQERILCRNNNLLTIKNSISQAADWYLGRPGDSGAESLVNYCKIFQNAPADEFGPGSSNYTVNVDSTAEFVNLAGGDYRIKSTSSYATAGDTGGLLGPFLEVSSGTTATINPSDQAQTIGQVTLTQHSILSINGATQAQSVDQALLTQANILSLNNLEHIQTAEQINLTQAHVVSVNNASQSQAVDQVILSEAGTLPLNSASNSQPLEQVVLSVIASLGINSLSNAQTVDQVVATTFNGSLISVNSATQQQLVDALTLQQLNIVTVDNLSQAQLLESINFNGVVVGYLQGALTIVSAYNGQIKLTNPLTGEIRIL